MSYLKLAINYHTSHIQTKW